MMRWWMHLTKVRGSHTWRVKRRFSFLRKSFVILRRVEIHDHYYRLHVRVLFKKKSESRFLQNKLLMMKNKNKQNPGNGSKTSQRKTFFSHQT